MNYALNAPLSQMSGENILNGRRRTIVILSAKRCGSTALYKTLVNHSSVKNCLVNGRSRNWEPAFWYHGWKALSNIDAGYMIRQFRHNYSYIDIPEIHTKEDIFDIWDRVLCQRGPIVLDKSPQYLGCRPALDLLIDYINSGRDVRVIGLIRDPRDAITSQYVKWHLAQEKKTGVIDSPERRAEKWLEKYKNLEYFQKSVPGTLMIRYEDFVKDSYRTTKLICDYCGIQYQAGMDSHVVPTNVGRHKFSKNRKVKKWIQDSYTVEFRKHLEKYGYL